MSWAQFRDKSPLRARAAHTPVTPKPVANAHPPHQQQAREEERAPARPVDGPKITPKTGPNIPVYDRGGADASDIGGVFSLLRENQLLVIGVAMVASSLVLVQFLGR